ncbi:MAG: prephenate dehydrogenase, partial [Verrucomicrobia bacterium]|nr:prephenate dehydrogenase [Verrucomicrobiota bacterium]
MTFPMLPAMQFNQATLVGMGLLGGSLGLALQKAGVAGKVTAYVRRASSVTEALELKVAHHATQSLEEAVADADLVVICTPIAQMLPLAEQMAPHLKRGAIVTDVGSVKASITQELEPVFARAGASFVGSHPMAGSEQVGMSAARVDLFQNAVCVVTPTRQTLPAHCEIIENLWRSVGGRPLRLSPEKHDELAGRASHLPHVVAAELAHYVLSPVQPPEQALLCAGGFRDTTRIASGSPEMWRDICLANTANLSRLISLFVESLEEFRHSLD